MELNFASASSKFQRADVYSHKLFEVTEGVEVLAERQRR